MSNIRFRKGRQKAFFDTVVVESNLSVQDLARMYNLSERSIRDWRREKYHANYETVRSLSERYDIPLVRYTVLELGWHLPQAAILGGIARVKLYGPPGNEEGRRKGGRISQERRRADPERYRILGCKVRKPAIELLPSEELAELFGVLIGDGSLTNYQIRVTLDKIVDKDYARFVAKLMRKIFNEEPYRLEREGVIDLILSSVTFVEALERLGLQRGSKVKHQVGIPEWIFGNARFQRACLRGLFDTDGGIYIHRKPRGSYVGWCFSNYSKPVIAGVSGILTKHGFKHSIEKGTDVRMYRLSDILRYMILIGSSNPKNGQRIRANQRKI